VISDPTVKFLLWKPEKEPKQENQNQLMLPITGGNKPLF
jgi:hypothetical protein